jgi:hypothetical protein
MTIDVFFVCQQQQQHSVFDISSLFKKELKYVRSPVKLTDSPLSNTTPCIMSDIRNEQGLNDDDSESSREIAELDLEIRRMSLHADSILQSIHEVNGDEDSPLLQLSSPSNVPNTKLIKMERKSHHSGTKPSKKPQAYLSYEDDDMTEEEQRLELIAQSIRESLAESHMNVPRMQSVSLATKTDCGINTAEKSDEVDQSNEILLLGCSIVWTMVMILFVHSQYFLLNEKGQISFPFSL